MSSGASSSWQGSYDPNAKQGRSENNDARQASLKMKEQLAGQGVNPDKLKFADAASTAISMVEENLGVVCLSPQYIWSDTSSCLKVYSAEKPFVVRLSLREMPSDFYRHFTSVWISCVGDKAPLSLGGTRVLYMAKSQQWSISEYYFTIQGFIFVLHLSGRILYTPVIPTVVLFGAMIFQIAKVTSS